MKPTLIHKFIRAEIISSIRFGDKVILNSYLNVFSTHNIFTRYFFNFLSFTSQDSTENKNTKFEIISRQITEAFNTQIRFYKDCQTIVNQESRPTIVKANVQVLTFGRGR